MSSDGSTRLLLVRHGESTWNADGRWQGQADPPLSALGEQQAADAAAHVDAVDAVWSSDLARARRTAEIIAHERGVDVRIDARLRERDAGEWQGYTRAEIEERWPGALDSGRPARGVRDRRQAARPGARRPRRHRRRPRPRDGAGRRARRCRPGPRASFRGGSPRAPFEPRRPLAGPRRRRGADGRSAGRCCSSRTSR